MPMFQGEEFMEDLAKHLQPTTDALTAIGQQLAEGLGPILAQLPPLPAEPETVEQRLERAEAALWATALAAQQFPEAIGPLLDVFERHGYTRMFHDAMFSVPP